MVDYLFRQKDFSTYEIAKFSDHMEPDDVYTIKNGHCNCPAYRRPCKHMAQLELFKLLQEEDSLEVNVLDGDTGKWYTPAWYDKSLIPTFMGGK